MARYMLGGIGKNKLSITFDPTVANGNPALLVRMDGEIDGVLAIRVEKARSIGLYYVRNPEKLNRADSETSLALR